MWEEGYFLYRIFIFFYFQHGEIWKNESTPLFTIIFSPKIVSSDRNSILTCKGCWITAILFDLISAALKYYFYVGKNRENVACWIDFPEKDIKNSVAEWCQMAE